MTNGKRGAPLSNLNRQKKLLWVESFDLSTIQGVNEVLRVAAQKLWTGELGSRTGDTLVRVLNLLKQGMENVELEERLLALEKTAKEVKEK